MFDHFFISQIEKENIGISDNHINKSIITFIFDLSDNKIASKDVHRKKSINYFISNIEVKLSEERTNAHFGITTLLYHAINMCL